jgi:hypothetical protein
MKFKKILPFIAIIGMIAWAISLQNQSDLWYMATLKKSLGLAVFIVCLFPSLQYAIALAYKETKIDLIPFVPLVGLIYGFYFGLSVLFGEALEIRNDVISESYVVKSLWLSLFGWLALMLGFYLLGYVKKANVLQLEWDPRRAKKMAFKLLIIGLFTQLIVGFSSIPGPLIQPVRLVSSFAEVGLGIYIILALRRYLRAELRFVVWCVLVPMFGFMKLSSGSTSGLLMYAVYIIMLIWGIRRKLPWLAISILIPIAILARGNADEFRSLTWGDGEYANVSKIEKSLLLVDLLTNNLSENRIGTFKDSVDKVSGRVSQLGIFAHCVDLTPASISYWHGETYKTLPASIIPRVLWPNKPSKTLGQDFGHRYQIINDNDFNTSINLPLLVEFYINFGPVGVLMGMFLLGCIYRLLYLKVNVSGVGDGVLLIGAFIFKGLINIESDFSLTFGLIAQQVIILYFVLKTTRPRRHRQVIGRK